VGTGTLKGAALVDELVGGSLAGKETKAVLKELEESSGVPLADVLMADVMAEFAKRAGKAPSVAAYGQQAKAELEDVAARLPAIKAALESDDVERVRDALLARKGVRPEALLKFVDIAMENERSLLRAAATGAGGKDLAAKIDDLLKRMPLEGNLEADARKLAKELAKADGDRLLTAVSEQISKEIGERLFGAIDDPAIRKRFEEELAAARLTGPDFAEALRARLRSALPEEQVQSVIARTMKQLDGTLRQKLVDEVLGSVTDPAVKALIDANFDAAGKLRLLSGYASFVKLYTEARRLKARESLIGWLYEASTFVTNAVQRATKEGADALRVALDTDKELRDLGVVIHDAVLHYDVTSLTGAGGKMRQGTDVLGTIPLSVGGKTVHVVKAALESKGESGIGSGVRQLLGLGTRFVKDSVVTTERGNFKVGHDLFLSVEEALAALGAGKEASRRAAETVAANSRAAIVVSPLGQAAGQRILDDIAARNLSAKDILYLGHDVPRATMERIAEGLAPGFGLQARASPKLLD
jgi:hypothetical protein